MKTQKHLKILNGSCVVENTTCFSEHAKHNVNCNRKKCKNWFNHQEANNCVLIGAKQGSYTLQKIGKIYDLSRMRICQIEKDILTKINNSS